MSYTICYVSTAKTSKLDSEIKNLMQRSCIKNIERDISGVIMFVNGTFFQVLEGEIKQVISLFNKIEVDKRHKNTIVLLNKEISNRCFADYGQGFSTITDAKQIKALKNYISEHKKCFPDMKTTLNLIKPFIPQL